MRTKQQVIEDGIGMEHVTGDNNADRIVYFSLNVNTISVTEACDGYFEITLSLAEFNDFISQLTVLAEELERRINESRAE